MTNTEITIRKYQADEGKVFDYKDPRYTEDEDGNQVEDHLYAKTLYLSKNDSIENYVEVSVDG